MSIGFRKSFLGFNCDDVMSYIERTHKEHAEQETLLNEKIEDTNSALTELQEKFSAVSAEKEKIAEELKEYTDKYEEIGRLSENIGKLYLVAQANAQAIMKNSAESRTLARDEVQRNLGSIAEAHRSLDEMKKELLDTTSGFAGEVERLIASLDDTREKIEAHSTDSTEHAESFESVYRMLAK